MLTKSRSGCRECRSRKVKCDEAKPVCSNCRRRYVSIQSCDWPTHSHAKARRKPIMARRETTANGALVRVFNPLPGLAADANRLTRLACRLTHHYATVVSYRMSECIGPASSRMWQDIVPRLSFEHDLVLDPMLALSALHLHSTSPNYAEIETAMRWYLDRALSGHRQALSTEKRVSEPLWLSAILLAHIHWLIVHQRCPEKAYELPLRGFNMFEGVTSLFFQGRVSLQELGYDWLWNGTLPQVSFNHELLVRAETSLRKIENELLQLFEAFDVLAMDEKVKGIYLSAKDYVLRCFRAFYSNTSPQSLRPCVGFMFLRCHAGYRKLLERHDPLALAIMARSLVLLHKIDHVWWLNGVGEYETIRRDIQGIRTLLPASLSWTMEWPCKLLESDLLSGNSQV